MQTNYEEKGSRQNVEGSVESFIDGIQNTIEERIERIEEIKDELEQGETVLINLNNSTPSADYILDLRRAIIDKECTVNDLQGSIAAEISLQNQRKKDKERVCVEILKGKEQFFVLSNEIITQMNTLMKHESCCLETYNIIVEKNLMKNEELISYHAEINTFHEKAEKKDPMKERTKRLIKAMEVEVDDKKRKLDALINEFNFLVN